MEDQFISWLALIGFAVVFGLVPAYALVVSPSAFARVAQGSSRSAVAPFTDAPLKLVRGAERSRISAAEDVDTQVDSVRHIRRPPLRGG